MAIDPHFRDLTPRQLWLLSGVVPTLCATVAGTNAQFETGEGSVIRFVHADLHFSAMTKWRPDPPLKDSLDVCSEASLLALEL